MPPLPVECQAQLISGLLAIAGQAEVYHLTIELNGRTITVTIGQGPAPPPAGKRQFSRLEHSLLAAVGPEWISAERIAEKAGERCGEGLRAVLGNLAELGLVESAPGRGYRRCSV